MVEQGEDKTSRNTPRRPSVRITTNVFRMAVALATLGVALVAILNGNDNAAIWTFLGMVITHLLGKRNDG